MISCEFCNVSTNIFSTERLQTTASGLYQIFSKMDLCYLTQCVIAVFSFCSISAEKIVIKETVIVTVEVPVLGRVVSIITSDRKEVQR